MSELTTPRLALRGEARLGDLYDAVTDSHSTTNIIDWESVKSPKIKNLKTLTCAVLDANTFFERTAGVGMHYEQQISTSLNEENFVHFYSLLKKDHFGSNKTTVGLFYEYVSREESVNIFHCGPSMKKIEENPQMTHIVTDIQFGYRAVVLLTIDGPPENNEKAIARVKDVLTIAKTAVDNSVPFSNVSDLEFAVTFFTDAPFVDTEERPSDLDGCMMFIAELPKRTSIDTDGGGDMSGVPLSYKLIPIAVLQSLLGGESARTLKPIEAATFENYERFYCKLKKAKDLFDELYGTFVKNRELFPADVGESIEKLNEDAGTRYKKLNVEMWEMIQKVRKDEQTNGEFGEFIENSSSLSKDLTTFVKVFQFVSQKTEVIKRLKDSGVIIVSSEGALQYVIEDGVESLVFFSRFRHANSKSAMNLTLFENAHGKLTRVFVDLDVADESLLSDRYPKNMIAFYRGGQIRVQDVLSLRTFLQKGYGAVKYDGEYEESRRPIRRVALQLKCPNSGKLNGCSSELREWSCYKCKTVIEYGFDGFLYCECGQWPVKSAEHISFFCSHSDHGFEFVNYDTDEELDMELKEIPKCKEYNVLLIGETGSGKSTWINAVINYVSAESLDEASKHELRYFIPAKFTMEDEQKELKTIVIGEEENDNESFVVGESSTQNPRSYTFNFGSQLIRLIDVPGIGDVRGAVKDRENFNKILRFVQGIPELHAICILLSPNETRLSFLLRYRLNELLTHLHSKATSNIIFCFTKTRTTFYRAGETLKTLKLYLEEYKIHVPLVHETMYCFDNEAFRLLCAEKNGIVLNKEERDSYAKSWEKSSSETSRLLQHVMQMVPHKTREMVSLYEIRRVIEGLTPALADISTNIQTNICLIEAKEVESKELVDRGEELSSKLKITQVVLVQKPIDYPRTVCVSAKCVTTSTILDTSEPQKHYRQICHSHCFLKRIKPETFPQQGLMRCTAMDKTRMACLKCGCSWDVHMHIYYMQEQKAKEIDDTTTRELLQKNADNLAVLDSHLQVLRGQKNHLEDCHRKITKYCACFGAFLRANSLVVYNDAMIQYLDYQIGLAKQNEAIAKDGKKLSVYCHPLKRLTEVERLERFKKEYIEEQNILKDESGKVKEISLDEVCRMKDELFAMKDVGPVLKRVLRLRKRTEDLEIDDSVKEVHQDIPRTSLRRFKPLREGDAGSVVSPRMNASASSHPRLAVLDEMAKRVEEEPNFWTDPSSSFQLPAEEAGDTGKADASLSEESSVSKSLLPSWD